MGVIARHRLVRCSAYLHIRTAKQVLFRTGSIIHTCGRVIKLSSRYVKIRGFSLKLSRQPINTTMVGTWDLPMTSIGLLIIFGPSIPPTSLLSFVALGAAYHILAPHFPAPKQAAWILTTISSFIMTLSSLPFLYDYLQYGGSVKDVRTFPALSIAANRFFQAYLVA